MNTDSPLMKLALQTASIAHVNQWRNDGQTPYLNHVIAVAEALYNQGFSEKVVVVGLLHDVLEDGLNWDATRLLDTGFPQEVVDAVVALTKVDGESYDLYLQRVKDNRIAQSVKIADMLHNLSSTPSDNQIRRYAKGLTFLLGN